MTKPVPKHLRTSRRWYDREGYEQPPALVGTSRAQGERSIEVWCDPCTRDVVLGTDELPEDMPLPDIPVILRLRCNQCGAGRRPRSRWTWRPTITAA